ncbi:MAG: hypothetical protein ACP5P4_05285 [Steroidobacteraceae bacterium]
MMYLDPLLTLAYDGDAGIATIERGGDTVELHTPFAEVHALFELLQREYRHGFAQGARYVTRCVRDIERALP